MARFLVLFVFAAVMGLTNCLPLRSRRAAEEYQAAASGGYGGREVIILDEHNGYGQHGNYGNNGGGGGGGYGGYGYDPIVVYIPHSEPYYPEYNVPLGGYGYSQPAHSPHYGYGGY